MDVDERDIFVKKRSWRRIFYQMELMDLLQVYSLQFTDLFR